MLCRCGLQGARGRWCGESWGQIVLKDAMEIADAERAENQDWNANARSPQDDAFLDVGAGEHRRARLLERGPDLRRTMTVRVRFDHRDDLWNGFLCGACEKVGDRAKVRSDRVKVYASDSRSITHCRRFTGLRE